MAPTVEGAGVELAYEERGEGNPVLLVHGIGGRSRLWPAVSGRVIAYDRRGYGGSGAPEHYVRTTVEEQAEDAAALIGALGAAPAVVAGEGLGALVALDLARRHRALVRGVVTVDAPLLAFVPEAAEPLAKERAELERVLRESGPAEAARAHLLAAGASAELADSAASNFRAFFADYGAVATWPVGRRDLRALDVPLVVLDGGDPPGYVRAASDALAGAVPGARRVVGGGVAEAVAALLAA
jgi:pimeloyl-ACP methyl ester carboxylesterase